MKGKKKKIVDESLRVLVGGREDPFSLVGKGKKKWKKYPFKPYTGAAN